MNTWIWIVSKRFLAWKGQANLEWNWSQSVKWDLKWWYFQTRMRIKRVESDSYDIKVIILGTIKSEWEQSINIWRC